jgi:selenocysteine lyase/cysteine desulfurase
VSPEDIQARLAAEDINVHLSKITSTRTDFERNSLPGAVVRASLSYYNTEEEIHAFMAAIWTI